jgi:NAD(P)-dependent dehydrogenase (short-subunit alcohol dehydrogenase family)
VRSNEDGLNDAEDEMERTTRRVWFVTGASRGFGAEIAAAALGAGDAVAATARHAKAVIDRFGHEPDLLATDLDVTDEASIRASVLQAVDRFGRIDVLVNNAGFGIVGAIEETSAEDIRRIYDTNVFGLLDVTRAVLPRMRIQHSGHVINMSSIAGYRSFPGYGIYCSTKFAVEALSEALHEELAPLGIHVTLVEPGYFRTDFLDSSSIVEAQTHIADYDGTAGETRKLAKARNHQQQGDPKRLAQAMLELVRSGSPPMRLPMGTDAVSGIEAKNAFVGRELETWRKLSVSTDFPALA